VELEKVLEAIQTESVSTGKPQQRRIAILRRDDGYFTFAEEYSYKSEYDGKIIAEGWARHPAEGIFESAELAEVAGQSTFLQRHKARS
jgi:hypothetical protein